MTWLWDAAVLTLGIATGIVLMPHLGHHAYDLAMYGPALVASLYYSATDLTDPEEHDQP